MNDIGIIYFKPINRAGRERYSTDGVDIMREIRGNSRSTLYQVRLNHRLAEDIKRVGCTHTRMAYNHLTGEYYIASGNSIVAGGNYTDEDGNVDGVLYNIFRKLLIETGRDKQPNDQLTLF